MTCPNCGQWMTTTGPAHVCQSGGATPPIMPYRLIDVASDQYGPTVTELDRLRARVAELEAERDDALARLAAAEQDAKRYRLVRRECSIHGMGAFWYGDLQFGFIREAGCNGPWRELRGPDDIDRAIDAAMGEGR